ncbi:hypothetical protein RF55_8083, partial [Lasius niger]
MYMLGVLLEKILGRKVDLRGVEKKIGKEGKSILLVVMEKKGDRDEVFGNLDHCAPASASASVSTNASASVSTNTSTKPIIGPAAVPPSLTMSLDLPPSLDLPAKPGPEPEPGPTAINYPTGDAP